MPGALVERRVPRLGDDFGATCSVSRADSKIASSLPGARVERIVGATALRRGGGSGGTP